MITDYISPTIVLLKADVSNKPICFTPVHDCFVFRHHKHVVDNFVCANAVKNFEFGTLCTFLFFFLF